MNQNQDQNHVPPSRHNPLVPFSYQSHQVRTIKKPDKSIWFVAKDVCDVLGIKNTSQAISFLDEDEKGISKTYTLRGEQDASIINESGLYALILRSNKPEAKTFRKWVTAEVLPAIRQNGAYIPEAVFKRCSTCGDEKPVTEFYRAAASSDGLKSQCKKCHHGGGRAKLPNFSAEPPITITAAISFGADAAIRLMEKLIRSGRDMGFVKKIAYYRNKGLSQKETGILMGATSYVIREYEALAKACGFYGRDRGRLPDLRHPHPDLPPSRGKERVCGLPSSRGKEKVCGFPSSRGKEKQGRVKPNVVIIRDGDCEGSKEVGHEQDDDISGDGRGQDGG